MTRAISVSPTGRPRQSAQKSPTQDQPTVCSEAPEALVPTSISRRWRDFWSGPVLAGQVEDLCVGPLPDGGEPEGRRQGDEDLVRLRDAGDHNGDAAGPWEPRS